MSCVQFLYGAINRWRFRHPIELNTRPARQREHDLQTVSAYLLRWDGKTLNGLPLPWQVTLSGFKASNFQHFYLDDAEATDFVQIVASHKTLAETAARTSLAALADEQLLTVLAEVLPKRKKTKAHPKKSRAKK